MRAKRENALVRLFVKNKNARNQSTMYLSTRSFFSVHANVSIKHTGWFEIEENGRERERERERERKNAREIKRERVREREKGFEG